MNSAVIFPAQPETILKGLGKLWTGLAAEEKQQGKPTVLRACAMTLVVASDEEGGGAAASQIISELMHEHPSRGIVLAVSKSVEHAVEARIKAETWKPFGKAQQIGCEQIEIISQPESWPNVGPTLAGLTVADLPVVFWCRHEAALDVNASAEQKAGLQAVLDLSTKVIVDTAGMDPMAGFELILRLQQNGRVVADLEWARLTFWRQPVAQVFDNPMRTNKFSNFHTVEIRHAGKQASAISLYAAGWFSSIHRAKVRFTTCQGYCSGLQGIRLLSDEETIDFERTGPETMRLVSTNGRERVYTHSEESLYALLNEELSITGHDPSFDAAFRRAQELLIG